VLCVR